MKATEFWPLRGDFLLRVAELCKQAQAETIPHVKFQENYYW
jgi:hypothetical protein